MTRSLARIAHGMALAACLLGSTNAYAADAAAPGAFIGRSLFPTVKWIGLEELYKKKDTIQIVDVRSNYEFATLHIKQAVNIPLANKQQFIEDVRKLRAASPEPIAFYCNGRACLKSYEAVMAAQSADVGNVFSYDTGVLDWAKQYPDETVLLGKSPLDPKRLLTKETFEQHSLSGPEFEQHIGAKAIVLDVRDIFQQEATKLFPSVQHSVPLDNAALTHYVNQANREGKTLLIYDATGQQVRWLQYFLEAENVKSYYFLKGGARAYYDAMLKEMLERAK